MKAREVTNNLISSVEDGFVTWEQVARACLSYMSEDEVKVMCRLNEFNCYLEEDEVEEVNSEITIEEENLNTLYYICVEHPSRDHIVIPNKIKNGVITVKDNYVSQTQAVLFRTYEEAYKASCELNTQCKTYVKQVGKVALTYLGKLTEVNTSIGKAYIQESKLQVLNKQEEENLKIKQEKKYLKYLEKKCEVCPLDKEECYDLYELRRKYK